MPRRGERNVQRPSQRCADHAQLTRSGDVNDVGAEGPYRACDGGDVANPGRIELQVLIQRDGENAAGQFQGCQVSIGRQWPRPLPGAHTQKGQVATTGEILKVARRVGDTVDFVK